MGFLDILNGMQNGPRGQTDPNAKGGMSPITMAILALLAYKGIKHVTSGNGNQTPLPSGNPPQRIPDQSTQAAGGGGLGDILGGLFGGQSPAGGNASAGGGGLGDLLRGPLGGMLAGGAAGSVLSGGLNDLLKQFQQNGQGDVAKSWVGTGQNQDISETDLARSIGTEDLDRLSQQFGISRSDLLQGLRRELPGAVDEMTPHGRLPTDDEASRWG